MAKRLISALIYDLDGTLIDSRTDLCHATNYMLTTLGFPAKSEEEIRSYIGRGVENLVMRALAEHKVSFDRGFELLRSYYRQHLTDHTNLYDGVIDNLDYFKDKRQFVLTNKLEDESKAILQQLGIAHFFTEILGDSDGKYLKPDPSKLTALLSRYQIFPKEAAIIGDSDIDVETGHRAKVITVFFSGGIGTLGAYQPDIIIKQMEELRKHFI